MGVDLLWGGDNCPAVRGIASIFAIYAAVTWRDPMGQNGQGAKRAREQAESRHSPPQPPRSGQSWFSRMIPRPDAQRCCRLASAAGYPGQRSAARSWPSRYPFEGIWPFSSSSSRLVCDPFRSACGAWRYMASISGAGLTSNVSRLCRRSHLGI